MLGLYESFSGGVKKGPYISHMSGKTKGGVVAITHYNQHTSCSLKGHILPSKWKYHRMINKQPTDTLQSWKEWCNTMLIEKIAKKNGSATKKEPKVLNDLHGEKNVDQIQEKTKLVSK